MIFDRTKNLTGHTIKTLNRIRSLTKKVYVINKLITKNTDNQEINNLHLRLFEKHFIRILVKYLDISINMTFGYPGEDSFHEFKKIRPLFYNHSADLTLSETRSLTDSEDLVVSQVFYLSFPTGFRNDVIITQNRGLYSPLEKMFKFYGWLTIVATVIILLITSVVIYFSNKRKNLRFSFTVFECLRLLTNNSIYTSIKTFKRRIFFFVIFWYFLVIQATFSGHLAAFLTKPKYKENAETLEDLKDQSYPKIYALPSNKNYIKDPLLWNKTMFASPQYLKNIIINESVAFISDIIHLQRFKVNKNFHVSKNLLNLGFSVLLMRHSWPLKERVNNVIMRITQSGIMDHWYDANHQIIDRNSKMIKEEYEDYYRPIQFDDIKFTFILLILGLLCALGCFLCEVFIRVFTTSHKKILNWAEGVKELIILIARIHTFELRRLVNYLYESFARK